MGAQIRQHVVSVMAEGRALCRRVAPLLVTAGRGGEVVALALALALA